MKIGLDIHGVCDKAPSFFSLITKLLIQDGHEIHVMTGEHVTKTLKEQLTRADINYTHLFSIADHHKSIGTEMWYDNSGNPWIDEKLWNRTKGDYSVKNNLDIVIDDTEKYAEFFSKIPFMLVNMKLSEKSDLEYKKMREIDKQKLKNEKREL